MTDPQEEISKLLEEVALLVMMLHPGDALSFDLVRESLQALKNSCEQSAAHPEYLPDLTLILEGDQNDHDAQLEMIKTFVERCQSGSFGTETVESKDKNQSQVDWQVDMSLHFDAELVSEFITQHRLMLDEFEASLLSALNNKSATNANIDGYCKGYLHSLKGDAGTVGLSGIEKVSHALEDLIVDHPVLELVEIFVAFKEWVLSCMQACVDKVPPRELSEQFLERLTASLIPAIKPAVGREAEIADSEAFYELKGEAEIFDEFVIEALDHLHKVEEVLLENSGQYSNENINSIFRAVHSIKGGSSYFNLEEMTRSSHLLENLLDQVRKGEMQLDNDLKDIILIYIDLQKSQFASAKKALHGDRKMAKNPELNSLIHKVQNTSPEIGKPLFEVMPQQKTMAELVAETTAGSPAKESKLDLKSFVKVETYKLDRLIEFIGEMVISSSMLIRNCRDLLSENENVISTTHQLEQISRELQGLGMSMRLMPIKTLFQKMSRLVWDTSKKINKEIIFKTIGEDTELDRTVIERLADPLMHMVRNSVDHGIETPEVRIQQGKPRSGLVQLSASHFGGSIIIRISDDGKGLDPQKILKKAYEKGILPEGHKLSLQETYQLIFSPGFSTADKVTDLSGRGVGMDVVKRSIESMRGRVSIDSEVGKGTVFSIELPLTLALIDGIETCVGEERFIIPTHSIIEFVKPKPSMITTTFGKGESLQFRGSFLPLFRLSDLYSMEPIYRHPWDAILVVVESNREYIALMLDRVIGTYSSVIKPLGPTFAHVQGLAGCAIMPDGNIGLILDVGTLVHLAHSRGSVETEEIEMIMQ